MMISYDLLWMIWFPIISKLSGCFGTNCYYESLKMASAYPFLQSHVALLDSFTACAEECATHNYYYTSVVNATMCYCGSTRTMIDVSYTPSNANCNTKCADTIRCGGEYSIDVGVSSSSSSSSSSSTSVTFLDLTPEITKLTVDVDFNASHAWIIDWGDGSRLTEHSENTAGMTHLYNDRGTYVIVCFLKLYPDVRKSEAVTATDNVFILHSDCNTDVGINISSYIDCSVEVTNLPENTTISYMLNSIPDKNFSASIVAEQIRHAGHVNTPGGSYFDAATMIQSYMILGNSFNTDAGYITKVSGYASLPSSSCDIGFFAALPSCPMGYSYCSKIGACRSSCGNATTTNPSCTGSTLCSKTGRCSVASCVTDTDIVTNQFSFVSIGTVTTAVTNFAIRLDREKEMYVPENHYIAIGCKSNCAYTAALINYVTNTRYENETFDMIVNLESNKWVVSDPTRTITVNMLLTIRNHESINLDPLFICEKAYPYIDVNIPYSSMTEAFLFRSSLSLSVQVTSSWNEDTALIKDVLCQEQIVMPTYSASYWQRYQTPFKIELNFLQGSPRFTKIDPGEIPLHYMDTSTKTLITGEDTIYDYDSTVGGPYLYTSVTDLNYSLPGYYTLTGNTSNAINYVIYSIDIHIVPPVTHQWIIEVDCPCYNILDQFTYRAKIPDGLSTVSLWNATFNFFLIDNQTNALVPLDEELRDFSTNGTRSHISSGPFVVEYSGRTIETAGNYTLYCQISNEISNATFRTQVEIKEAIRDVTGIVTWDSLGIHKDGLGPDMDIYLANFTLYFNLTVRTGFPDEWRLFINETGTDEISSQNFFSHLIVTHGVYTVKFGAWNTVQGWVYSEELVIHLVYKIDGFTLLDNEENIKKPGQVKTLTGQFSIFTPIACILLDFGDGSPKGTYGFRTKCKEIYPDIEFVADKATAPVEFTHTYSKEGRYTVRAIAFDSHITLSQDIPVVIADIACTLPNVTIIDKVHMLSSAPSSWRSMKLRIETLAGYHCNKTVPVKFWWTLTKVNESTGVSIKDIVLQDIIGSWNSSQLTIPVNFLEYGLYKFSYFFELHASKVFILERTDFTYMEISKTPLRAIMIDGSSSQLTRGFGQLLNLSASSLSFDPDYPDDKKFNYTWWCQINPGTLKPEADGFFAKTNNVQEIPEALVAAKAKLKGGGCFGVGDGTISGVYPKILLNTASFVSPQGIYEIILEIEKGDRRAITSLIVTVNIVPPPSVQIKCDPALCWSSSSSLIFNPTQRLALSGSCIADCSEDMILEWTIVNHGDKSEVRNMSDCELADFLDLENDANTDDSECTPAFLTPLNGSEILLSTEFFKINSGIKFSVRLTITTSDITKGFYEITIQKNLPPVGGHCSINALNSTALIDTYTVQCDKWIDPEGIGLESYTFYYLTRSPTGTVKTTLASTSQASLDMTLPVGVFEVYVDIYDVLKGYTVWYLGNISAILPTEEQLTNFDHNTVIAYLSTIGDQVGLAMTLASLSSIRDKATWFSLDTESMNLTDDELTERLIAVGNMNKEQLKLMASTMDFSSLTQLEVGANVIQRSLQGIFDSKYGALTIDVETSEIAMDVLNKMANLIPSMDVSSPYQLEPFLSKVMDAMSGLLEGIKVTQGLVLSKDGKMSPSDEKDAESWDYESFAGENFEAPKSKEEMIRMNIAEKTRSRSKEQVNSIYDILHTMANEVQKKAVSGEIIVCISKNGAILRIGKLNEVALISGYKLSVSNGGIVILPKNFCPSRYVMKNTNCNNEIGFMLIDWPTISHFYPKSSKVLSLETHVIHLEITMNGVLINVNNESSPIIHSVPRTATEMPEPRVVNNSDLVNPHLPIVYHNFHISNFDTGYTIEIIALSLSREKRETEDNYLPSDTIVLIDHERLPTYRSYLKAIKIEHFVRNNDSYTYFVNNTENNNRTGRFFVGVARITNYDDFIVGNKLKYSNFISTFSPSYTFRVYTSGCYFYDEDSAEWTSRNLILVDATPIMVTCASPNLAPIASGFQVVPNTVDFTFIFSNAGFQDNLTIYITIFLVSFLYIIFMIWGHQMDQRDYKRRGAIPLPDNKLEDKYLYEIKFYTGPDSEATTDSNLMFIASGDYGETTVREMPPANRILYRRFGVDTIVMSVPRPLGHINMLRIFHDNSGEPPLDTWQLEMVVFRDLQSDEKSIFNINQWLAFNRDEGSVDKTFHSTDNYDDGKSFSEQIYIKSNRIVNQDHMFLAMFARPVGSRFGRKERVTVCAVFIFLSMLFSAFWYSFEDESPRDGYFNFGPFTFSLNQLLSGGIGILVVYPVAYLFTFIYKRARPKNLKRCRAIESIEKQRLDQCTGNDGKNPSDKISVEINERVKPKPKDKSPVTCIPWWTRYIAWIVSLLLIAGSVFFVWAFGIMWGEIKTSKWLSSFLLSFIISLLISQWLKVAVISVFSSLCCKFDLSADDVDCDEELPRLKINEKWNEVVCMNDSTRKKINKVEGVDIQKKNIASLRKRLLKEREITFVLKGIFVYLIFLTIVYLIANLRTDYSGFLLQNHLKNTFIKKGHKIFDFANKIKTSDDWWRYAKSIILQELRAQRDYNGEPPYGLRGFMDDRANRLIGYALIRQIRTKRYNCVPPSPMHMAIDHCSGMRSIDNEETGDFCAGWMLNESSSGSCKWDEFKYRTGDELQSFSTTGRLGYYGGGGYVIRLNGPQREMINRFDELQRKSWIDRNTRAVILEFSVYNVNINLFSTCMISAEFNDGGGILPKWRFEPIKLIKTDSIGENLNTICELLFVIATAFFTLREIWKMKKEKCMYLSDNWNILEIAILIVSYITIALYFLRYVVTQEALTIFKQTNGNGYIRMDTAAVIDQFFLFSLAFIIFFCTLKIIKLLQFNNRMNVLALTIMRCWDELKIFFIAFFIIFFAFSCLFFFIFHTALEHFAQIVPAILTSFKMMMGKFDFAAMNAANPMSPILFFIFSVMNSMILVNIMLTIIIQAFNEIKQDLEKKDNRLNVIDQAWSSFKQFLRLEQPRSVSVIPILDDKKDYDEMIQDDENEECEQLPDKVSQLLKYINNSYFDGKLDMANQKQMLREKVSSNPEKFEPSINARKIINSDI